MMRLLVSCALDCALTKEDAGGAPALHPIARSGMKVGAGAVEAAVIRAGPTRASDLLPQRFAGAEDSHTSVAGRNAERVDVGLDRDALDLHASQSVRILGLERVRELADATTGDRRQFFSSVPARFELGGELIEPAIGNRLPSLPINHGVSQDSIEPTDHGLTDLVTAIEAANERVLHDLLGNRSVSNSPLYEPKKGSVICDQRFQLRMG